MATTAKFLTPARCNAVSRVFLNVFQFLLVGMFLSETFIKLAVGWRMVAVIVMTVFFVLGVWFATENAETS